MKREEFFKMIKEHFSVGNEFDNPKKGTSKIISITSDKITYRRINSSISLKIDIMYDAFIKFKGKKCSASDLEEFNDTFRKNVGHTCNCSFFFIIMRELGLSSEIKGKGVVGNPFYVEFK